MKVGIYESRRITILTFKLPNQHSGLTNSLPANVQILTLEPWKATTFLLRLEHVFERKEDPVLSRPVTVDLKVNYYHRAIFIFYDSINYRIFSIRSK